MKCRLLRALGLVPLLLAAGCATTAMKGTPFFTGEYQARQGAAEDRVNLWPLAYYREPALSALWPLGEYVKDEHFAVRPLFSVYNLDEPGRREWNVLWPLIQQDNRTGTGRGAPIFWWGDDYFTAFPLYWRATRPGYLRDFLFPLWWYERSAQRQRFITLLGLAGYDRGAGYRSWWAAPFAGDFNRPDGSRYRYWLWPLGHDAQGADGRSRWSAALPLWYSAESDEAWRRMAFLFWWQGGARNGEAWRMLLPLFWSSGGADRSSFYTLLGGGSRSGEERSWLVPLLLSGGRSEPGERSAFALGGLGRWSEEDGRRSSHLFPFYAAGASEEESHFYSLPWWRKSRGDGTGWTASPLHYRGHYRDGHLTLSPLYVSGSDRTAGSDWHAVLPLYYSAQTAERHTFATLLGGRETGPDGKSTTIYPLLSRVAERDGVHDWWLLAPLAHFRWGGGGSRSHVFPLYYSDEAKETFLSPFYAELGGPDDRLSIAPPLLSWRQERGPRDDWWLLGGLGRLSLGEERGPSHVVPVYYRDPARGLTLSPVYCEWARPGGTGRFFPPLLSGWAADAERREFWSLAGLYSHEWRRDGSASDWLLPFYMWEKDRYFYTPLAGGNRDGFRYYLTPLVSSWKNERERGHRVFPLYARSRTPAGETRSRFLWSVSSSRSGYRRSVFFPFYGYTDFGPRGDAPPPERVFQTGKDLFCLPLCWYQNTESRTAPSGAVTRTFAHGAFPLWSYETRAETQRGQLSEQSLLWFLYDRRRESEPPRSHEYVRHRVLWRLWHYEKLNGDVSVDALPGITWDARKDGYRKVSFLWRVFRWEKSADGKRKLDVLFLPLRRDR